MARKRKPDYFIEFWNNECPAAGDGFRGVAVLKVGRKWVHLMITGTQDKARMAKKVWDALPKHVIKRGKLTGEVVY